MIESKSIQSILPVTDALLYCSPLAVNLDFQACIADQGSREHTC